MDFQELFGQPRAHVLAPVAQHALHVLAEDAAALLRRKVRELRAHVQGQGLLHRRLALLELLRQVLERAPLVGLELLQLGEARAQHGALLLGLLLPARAARGEVLGGRAQRAGGGAEGDQRGSHEGAHQPSSSA